MKRFEDKIVLVTGSVTGIGKETAVCFAREGAKVIVHGPDYNTEITSALEQVIPHSRESISLVCDLQDPEAIRKLFKKIKSHFGRLDVLVNNAATQNSVPFIDMPEEDWDRIMAVNLKAPFLCGQLAARMMKEQGGGKIINIGSVHEYQTKRNFAHYSSAKGGLVMLTKNMALELAEYNIQVNQVAPGAIATRLTDPDRQKQFLTAVPAGRVGSKREIANMVLFLASEEANYITGSSFTVDGGLTLGFCASRPDL